VKALGRLVLVAAIAASTYYAILRVAEHKADALAGGDTFRLDGAHPEEKQAFDALVGQLRRWEQSDLAESLLSLQEQGRLFVAPRLAGERSAIYVDALGLVRRIYLRPDELLSRRLPFPDLDAPATAQRTFTRIRLAGTLYHELQHYGGLEDEGATYDREIAWYRRLRDTVLPGLRGERARWFEWAVDSALDSAAKAREKATGVAPNSVDGGGSPWPARPTRRPAVTPEGLSLSGLASASAGAGPPGCRGRRGGGRG
jgi:hypothetical protein